MKTVGMESGAGDSVRVALFNIRELSREKLTAPRETAAQMTQVEAAVAVIALISPDVLVVQEIDQGPDDDPAQVARLFAGRLADAGIDFPHVWAAPSNTGRLSGLDLDGDGQVATPAQRGTREHGNDSWGYGTYPGQYSMAVLSRFPIEGSAARTFQRFPWTQLPGNHLAEGLYAPDVIDRVRLSSKSHWDLPVRLGGEPDAPILRLLISHPTPPGFDGPEDRNGRRNFDELRFWKLYLDAIDDLERGLALVDDRGRPGGYPAGEHGGAPFVLLGDLNARPDADESIYDGMSAIGQLLGHPLLRDPAAWLTSEGALVHAGDDHELPSPRNSTAVFRQGMRLDYLLPARSLSVLDGGVFWPSPAVDAEGARLASLASDHRLVWLDLALPSP
jgi:endonuclease/exonuclease/phosphatase family metal-dependent hydrolase